MAKVVICGINTATLPKITEKESAVMLAKIADGDARAREDFIVANMRLVLSVIKRFWMKSNSDDMFQAGMTGLIKAIDNFDVKFNVKFSTYAVPMIIGEIKRFLRDGNSLRISRSIRDTAYRVLKTRTEIEKNNQEATLERIAAEMQVKLSEVVYCLDAISDTVSLYDPVYSKNGDELLLMDQIGDERNTEEKWSDKVAIERALDRLESRERDIIYLRYFEGKTQTEISKAVGISQAQVSRLEKNALSVIKNSIKA
ncbi:MAG: sigma-70 family RNA polymerase sigma factor [Clostridia bacterium]|nr:sigma-70 family RNA polymerase sigma factor [Clostridia bacterium]